MKKHIIRLIIALVICIICGILVHFLNEKVFLRDETKQVEALQSMYNDFIGDLDDNISLDDSAIRNFVTGEYFSDENQQLLKSVENIADSDVYYKLYVSYNSTNNVLTLTLKSNMEDTLNIKLYKLKPNLFNINYSVI